MRRTAPSLLLACALAIAVVGPRAGAAEGRHCAADLFCVESRKTDRQLELWLDVMTAQELTLMVTMELFEPRIEHRMHRLVVDRPGRQLLIAVAVGRTERALFTWDVAFHPGVRPAVVDPAAVYRLPYGEDESYQVVQGADGAFSHRGRDRFAVDWGMPEGTLVRAARAGRVIGLFEDSAKGGPDPRWRGWENFLWIEHDDGTVGWYAHFRRNSILVEPGQEVATGDPLGYSGATGFASEPHLHFQVSTIVDDPAEVYRTVPLRFLLDEGEVAALRAGRSYRAPRP